MKEISLLRGEQCPAEKELVDHRDREAAESANGLLCSPEVCCTPTSRVGLHSYFQRLLCGMSLFSNLTRKRLYAVIIVVYI